MLKLPISINKSSLTLLFTMRNKLTALYLSGLSLVITTPIALAESVAIDDYVSIKPRPTKVTMASDKSKLATDMKNRCLIYHDSNGQQKVYGNEKRWADFPMQVCASENVIINGKNEIDENEFFTFNLGSCRVTQVYDGDSFRCVMGSDKHIFVHLEGIDAPEIEQDFGKEAAEHLRNKMEGQSVYLYITKADTYGRYIGTVYAPNPDKEGYYINVNQDLIKNGYAWLESRKTEAYYPVYNALLSTAKKQKLGLWKDSEAQRPSDYRKEHLTKK